MTTATLTKPLPPSFAAMSHPEPEERERATLELMAPSPAAGRRPDESVRAQVHAILWKDKKGEPPLGKFRQATLAREMGINDGVLSMYLNHDGTRDLGFDALRLEASIVEFLAGLESPREAPELRTVFDTPLSDDLIDFCRYLRSQGWCGVYSADAGSGKDCGMLLLQHKIPRTVCITASQWLRSGDMLIRILYRKLNCRQKGGVHVTKGQRIAEVLREKPRQIVINNAQRLTASAYKLLFDLYDQGDGDDVRTTIVFVGNPEIEEKLSANDQFARRIGTVRDGNGAWEKKYENGAAKKVDPLPGLKRVCRELIKLHCPGHEAALTNMAAKIAIEPGSGRIGAVVKRLITTRKLLDTPAFKAQPERAFKAAHAGSYCRINIDLGD